MNEIFVSLASCPCIAKGYARLTTTNLQKFLDSNRVGPASQVIRMRDSEKGRSPKARKTPLLPSN